MGFCLNHSLDMLESIRLSLGKLMSVKSKYACLSIRSSLRKKRFFTDLEIKLNLVMLWCFHFCCYFDLIHPQQGPIHPFPRRTTHRSWDFKYIQSSTFAQITSLANWRPPSGFLVIDMHIQHNETLCNVSRGFIKMVLKAFIEINFPFPSGLQTIHCT